MPAIHSLLTVHAHPDDETIATGGVMARYARAGHRDAVGDDVHGARGRRRDR